MKPLFDFIADFFTNLYNFFVDLFKYLFIPSENFFSDKITESQVIISSKVGIDLSSLEVLQTAAAAEKSSIDFVITFNFFGEQRLDLNFIKQAQPYTQAIFMGLFSILLCWYNYKNIANLFKSNTPEGKGR